jgi:transcriptional regulator with XRE-family HTH domain
MRYTEMSDAFAVVLRKHREAKDMSQEKLAEKSGLHPTYVGMVERHLRNPSVNAAQAFADALGLSLSKMMAEAEALLKK